MKQKALLFICLVAAICNVSAAAETPSSQPAHPLSVCAKGLACAGLMMWLGAGIAAVDGKICATAAMIDDFPDPLEGLTDLILGKGSAERARAAQRAAQHERNMATARTWFGYGGIALGAAAGAAAVGGWLGSRSDEEESGGEPNTDAMQDFDPGI